MYKSYLEHKIVPAWVFLKGLYYSFKDFFDIEDVLMNQIYISENALINLKS